MGTPSQQKIIQYYWDHHKGGANHHDAYDTTVKPRHLFDLFDFEQPRCMACRCTGPRAGANVYKGDEGIKGVMKHWSKNGGGGFLERAHIIPKSRGGTDDPSNFVLLCSQCHHENPNYAGPRAVEFYQLWLDSVPEAPDRLWADFLGHSASSELERKEAVFKAFFGEGDGASVCQSKLNEMVEAYKTNDRDKIEEHKKVSDDAVMHWGGTGMNFATILSIIKALVEGENE